MKRRILSVLVAAAFMAASASPALADAGAPGETYPEQPGANVQTACVALQSNLETSALHKPSTAFAIGEGLVIDACFGG